MIGASAARAADSREAREREARKACFTGNVDRGVEILVDLYGETGHPNYIYNQARCFERNGKYDQALLSYEDYLRKAKDLGNPERAQVEKSIAELRAKMASPPTPGGGEAAAPVLLSPALDARAPRRPRIRRRPRCRRPELATRRWLTAAGRCSEKRGSCLWSSRAGDWRWASPEPCSVRGGAAISTTYAPSSAASRCRVSSAPDPIAVGSTTP